MKITRENQSFELTLEELYEAYAEFIKLFMKSELANTYGLDEEKAKEVAERAFDRYCEGNGETEGECVEWAFDNQSGGNECN